jgi:hypothetical protein
VGSCVFWGIAIEVRNSKLVMLKNEGQQFKQKWEKGMNKWREGE